MLTGTYGVSVIRLLTAAERGRLTGDDAEVSAYGGGGSVTADTSGADATVLAAAGRRGSLVISEFQFAYINPRDSYRFSGFLELYNNSDTTLYLDGKIVGEAWERFFDYPNYGCAASEPFRLDPRGIRSLWFYKFPGTGRQYALPPGRAVVIATDAIDHSQLVTGGLNLSNADFEFIGGSDVDNPSVPNMVFVGPGPASYNFFGHGMYYYDLDRFAFVADSLDVSALAMDTPPNSNSSLLWALIPAPKILDVGVFLTTYQSTYPRCTTLSLPNIDRQPGQFLFGDEIDRSLHRRVLTTTPEGRLILLRTKTTARDFEIGPNSPGSVP